MLLVTVVASSAALQGTQSEFTDASGQYLITNLPPGTYSLLFIYGDAKVKRDNVEVGVGKVTVANARINTAATEVITVKEKAPTIDAGSSKQGTTIEKDYLKNVPSRGRTWAGVLQAAGGSQGDVYGTSFSGSTSIENNYVVDGLNTSGVTLGQGFPTQGSQVLNNFIQEIEVITGGYNAEFGRSTGGVVNVVTKTGSNEFHGSVFANVTAFNATTDDIPVVGNSLRSQFLAPTDVDFGFELGGPIIKDKLWFFVGFAPQLQKTNTNRIVSRAIDRNNNNFNYSNPNCPKNTDGTCDGDGNPATTAKVGCEATNSCEGDGIIDSGGTRPLFEDVDSTQIGTHNYTYQFIGKLNFAVTPEHQGQIAFTGQPGSATVLSLQFPDGTPTGTSNERTTLNTDLTVKWTSKFNDNKTQIDFLGGWHRYYQKNDTISHSLPNSPSIDPANYPGLLLGAGTTISNLSRAGVNRDTNETDKVLAACTDAAQGGNDPFPNIINCPESAFGYQMNSRIALQTNTEQRLSGKLALTERIKAAGHHQFKVGADIEQNLLDSNRRYSGGQYYTNVTDTSWRELKYVDLSGGPDDCQRKNAFAAVGPRVPCTYKQDLPINSFTLNWGAFVQDSWSILPNLTINAGLRYEQQRLAYPDRLRDQIDLLSYNNNDMNMTGATTIGTYAMTLTDLVAPRVGLIYDWTKEGRSKIYANWGRFYESIPLDINNREFGGESQYRLQFNNGATVRAPDGSRVPGACSSGDVTDPRLPTSPYNCPNVPTELATTRLIGISPGNPFMAPNAINAVVMPGTGAQYLDEFVVGVEYELIEDLRVGISYQNRRLGNVIEDMSTDGANDYFVGNPGNFDNGEQTKLINQLNQLRMADPTDPRIGGIIQRINSYENARRFDSPRRVYNAIQLTASKRFARNFMIQGSYTYSKLEGNYPGLFSPDTGQLDPNITSQYDLFELLGNRMGDLPFDRPHNFKLDGYYTFDLKDAGSLTLGARLRGQSGTPITPLASHVYYGNIESYLNPRGSGGRTAIQVNSDLHLAYTRKLGPTELSIFFELFNIFNNQEENTVDQEYSIDNADPVIGGSASDLAYVKPIYTPLNGDGNGGASGSVNGGPNGGLADASGLMQAKNPIVKKLNFGAATQRVAPLSGRIGASLSF